MTDYCSLQAPQPVNPTPVSERTIYDELLPGTHDSAAYAARPDLVSRTTVAPLLLNPIRSAVASVQTDFALTQTLSIYEQLCAGARFLDIRVTKRPGSTGDNSFWTHHGMVLCVPLASVIDQINLFHNQCTTPIPIITVFRPTSLLPSERAELSKFVYARARHPVFQGTALGLRQTPVSSLPPNVFAGLQDSQLDISWGRDPWLDTFSENKKITFLSKILKAARGCATRNDLLVLGWTVTPSVLDIILRAGSFGLLRDSVLGAASKMNSRFTQFIVDQGRQMRDRANVIFFDGFTKQLADDVISISNKPHNEYITNS